MKKKLMALLVAMALMAGLTIPAVAVSGTAVTEPNQTNTGDVEVFVGSPSLKPEVDTDSEQIEIVTDNVVTGGYIRTKGITEARPLEKIDYPVIKITTLSMSQAANAKVDSSNPEATDSQKADMMTESGVTYVKNKQVNEAAERYYAAESTSEFVDSYDMSFVDTVVAASRANLKDYAVIQIVDISANSLAREIDQSVRLSFSAPGVQVGSKVTVGRIENGTLEFVSAQAGNGSISFNVNPHYLEDLGTYVLMTRVG